MDFSMKELEEAGTEGTREQVPLPSQNRSRFAVPAPETATGTAGTPGEPGWDPELTPAVRQVLMLPARGLSARYGLQLLLTVRCTHASGPVVLTSHRPSYKAARASGVPVYGPSEVEALCAYGERLSLGTLWPQSLHRKRMGAPGTIDLPLDHEPVPSYWAGLEGWAPAMDQPLGWTLACLLAQLGLSLDSVVDHS